MRISWLTGGAASQAVCSQQISPLCSYELWQQGSYLNRLCQLLLPRHDPIMIATQPGHVTAVRHASDW